MRTLICNHEFVAVRRNLLSVSMLPSSSFDSSVLLTKSWFDDDLPNILGINPIEATIIFGALYYLYGPTALYDFARAAGNFVSTYLPIVQSIAQDIFKEFQDYFEEDKERDSLKKQGFDVSNMPRRTSNVLERLQQGFAAISDVANVQATSRNADEAILDGDGSFSTITSDIPVTTPQVPRNMEKRLKKRDVILDNGMSLDSVIEISDKTANPELDLSESVQLVKSKFEELKSKSAIESAEVDVQSMNKFQQQLSGQWNSQVLENQKYEEAFPMPWIDSELDSAPQNSGTMMPLDISSDDELSETEIRDLLEQIDQDYNNLRSRLLTLIKQRETQQIKLTSISENSLNIDGNINFNT